MNQRKLTGIVCFSLSVAALGATTSHAASPAFVDNLGTAVKWNASSINYVIDQGDLGLMKHADAAALVDQAFQQWSSVPTAKLTFQRQPDLTTDLVTVNDVNNVLGNLDASTILVIFDNQGAILNSPTFGSFVERTELVDTLRFSADGQNLGPAVVVVNGRAMDGLFGPDDVVAADLQRAITRAIGEVLGVGDSVTNDELRYNGNTADNSAVPVMFRPTEVSPTVLGGGTALTLDDQMSVTDLYPSATANTTTGWIQGTLTLPDGKTGIQGVEVVASRTDDPVKSAVSALTGITFRSSGGAGKPDPTLRGAFKIRLPPGDYTLSFMPQGVPIPGGPQVYQSATSTAVPPTALTVVAGKVTPADFTLKGTPAPDPQAVTQITPNNTPITAQMLPPSAIVTGTISNAMPGTVVVPSVDAPSLDNQNNVVQHNIQDKIENLYRLVVPARSLVTLYLEPQDAIDLDLYLLNGFRQNVDNFNNRDGIVGSAVVRDTLPESLQGVLEPGTYTIGVSAADYPANSGKTQYHLTVLTTPLGDQPPSTAPVLDHLVLGNVTATGADASWTTDLDSTGDAVAGMPLQDFGDTAVGKAHHTTLTGLSAGAAADVTALSQLTDGVNRGSLPRVFFRTADATAATGAAQLSAVVMGSIDDSANVDKSVLVAVSIQNTGGAASSVQITTLTPSAGWMLAQPITQPLAVGSIGSGGTAIVMVRLLPDGSSPVPAPLASVTGAGSLADASGATTNFTISGP
jgi:hypothetical protein